MGKKIIQAMQEVLEYSRGDKSRGFETKMQVPEPVDIPGGFDVRSLRKYLHMSQAEFAARFGFNLNTLRNWEYGRRHPDQAVLAYLWVISKNPEFVEKSLRSK